METDAIYHDSSLNRRRMNPIYISSELRQEARPKVMGLGLFSQDSLHSNHTSYIRFFGSSLFLVDNLHNFQNIEGTYINLETFIGINHIQRRSQPRHSNPGKEG